VLLSQAILKGCLLYPHHSRFVPFDNANGASTVGAAYAALVDGRSEWVRNCQTDYEYREFPVLAYWVRDPISHRDNLLEDVIWRLEDLGGSRESIAAWVGIREERWIREGVRVDSGKVRFGSRGESTHPNRLWRKK
jgi:hypothetical protein